MIYSQRRISQFIFIGLNSILTAFSNAGDGSLPYFATEICRPVIHQFGLPGEAIYPSQNTYPAIGYSNTTYYSDTPDYVQSFQQVGRVDTDLGKGSGTVVRPRTVLTAGHVIYGADQGFTKQVKFRRNFNGGPRHVPAGNYSIDRSENSNIERQGIRIWAAYQNNVNNQGASSNASFSDDFAVVYYNTLLSRGGHAGYAVNFPDAPGRPAALKVPIGYGGENGYDSSRPLAAWTYSNMYLVTGSYWVNYGIRSYNGMSGGPLFQRQTRTSPWYVRGVLVSGYSTTTISGYRVIDTHVYNYIRNSP